MLKFEKKVRRQKVNWSVNSKFSVLQCCNGWVVAYWSCWSYKPKFSALRRTWNFQFGVQKTPVGTIPSQLNPVQIIVLCTLHLLLRYTFRLIQSNPHTLRYTAYRNTLYNTPIHGAYNFELIWKQKLGACILKESGWYFVVGLGQTACRNIDGHYCVSQQHGIVPCIFQHNYAWINPLNTKHRLLYLKTRFVPRSKHFSSQL